MEDCLEEHREDAGFSGECKEEFEVMMEARAADFRLDFSLREKCIEDIFNLCGYEKVRFVVASQCSTPSSFASILCGCWQPAGKMIWLLIEDGSGLGCSELSDCLVSANAIRELRN